MNDKSTAGWPVPPEPTWHEQRASELFWRRQELERQLFACREELRELNAELEELECVL